MADLTDKKPKLKHLGNPNDVVGKIKTLAKVPHLGNPEDVISNIRNQSQDQQSDTPDYQYANANDNLNPAPTIDENAPAKSIDGQDVNVNPINEPKMAGDNPTFMSGILNTIGIEPQAQKEIGQTLSDVKDKAVESYNDLTSGDLKKTGEGVLKGANTLVEGLSAPFTIANSLAKQNPITKFDADLVNKTFEAYGKLQDWQINREQEGMTDEQKNSEFVKEFNMLRKNVELIMLSEAIGMGTKEAFKPIADKLGIPTPNIKDVVSDGNFKTPPSINENVNSYDFVKNNTDNFKTSTQEPPPIIKTNVANEKVTTPAGIEVSKQAVVDHINGIGEEMKKLESALIKNEFVDKETGQKRQFTPSEIKELQQELLDRENNKKEWQRVLPDENIEFDNKGNLKLVEPKVEPTKPKEEVKPLEPKPVEEVKPIETPKVEEVKPIEPTIENIATEYSNLGRKDIAEELNNIPKEDLTPERLTAISDGLNEFKSQVKTTETPKVEEVKAAQNDLPNVWDMPDKDLKNLLDKRKKEYEQLQSIRGKDRSKNLDREMFLEDKEIPYYQAVISAKSFQKKYLNGKHPWEVTKDVYQKAEDKWAKDNKKSGTPYDYWETIDHKHQVEMTLRDGDFVPDNVLKDYPDLVENPKLNSTIQEGSGPIQEGETFTYKGKEFLVKSIGTDAVTGKSLTNNVLVTRIPIDKFKELTGRDVVAKEIKNVSPISREEQAIVKDAEKVTYTTGENGKQIIDKYVADGYNEIISMKRGATNRYYLDNKKLGKQLPISGPLRKYAEFVIDKLKNEDRKPIETVKPETYTQAIKNIKSRGNQLNTGIDPTVLKDLYTVGKFHLENGLKTFREWGTKIINEVGDWIKPHLRKLWDEVTKDRTGLKDVKVQGISKDIGGEIKDIAKKTFENVGEAVDNIRRVLAPASRGKEGKITARIMTEELAKKDQFLAQADKTFEDVKKIYSKNDKQTNLDIIDAIETGKTLSNPNDNFFAKKTRQLLESEYKKVQQRKGTEAFIENYFPHFWEQGGKNPAMNFFKKPLEGSKSFLKQRTIPTTADGIAKGLVPVTYNPVEMVMLKLAELKKFNTAHDVFDEMGRLGMTKFVELGDKAPDGWKKVNDYIRPLNQKAKLGSYYLPEPSAKIINNYLSPGLQNNIFYKTFRSLGNTMNQVQLGLSAFHGVFTSIDANISKFALGIQKLSRGDIKGAMDIAQSPLAFITNPIEGSKLRADYFSENPRNPALVEALTRAGGRVSQDVFYQNNLWQTVKKNFADKKYISGSLKTPFALAEQMSKPILDYLVPRQKLGIFSDMAQDILKQETLGKLTRNEATLRLQEAWRSVDNRMGQMVYDNLYWNKVFKDLAMVSVRSVGWNLGTFRELGGGLADIHKLVTEKRITPRLAYTLSLPIVAGLTGAVYNYLNGQQPESVKDLYFPKTGKKNYDGTDERVSLPTYIKDVASYVQQPMTTLGHKLHPAIGSIEQMFQNHDYYGTEITEAPTFSPQWFIDNGKFMVKQFTPFSLSSAIQLNQQGEDLGKQLGSFFGLQMTPGYIRRNDIQNSINSIYEARNKGTIQSQNTAETIQIKSDIASSLKQGNKEDALAKIQDALNSGKLSNKQIDMISKNSGIDKDIRQFSSLDEYDQKRLVKAMDEEDLKRYLPYVKAGMYQDLKDVNPKASEVLASDKQTRINLEYKYLDNRMKEIVGELKITGEGNQRSEQLKAEYQSLKTQLDNLKQDEDMKKILDDKKNTTKDKTKETKGIKNYLLK